MRDGDGVLMFDAGARTMANAVAAAAAQLGGLTRIVLGHGHTDHRGTAPSFDVPVLCHPDEVVDAEGSGGWRYWDDVARVPELPAAPGPQVPARAARWDGGPVKIAGTVDEGDDVAGFKVVHMPGHAPGLIALWRERDRVALTSDAFYAIDMWGRDCEPHLPIDGLQLRHRAGARVAAQARRARPGGLLPGPREAAERRRARAARAGGGGVDGRAQPRSARSCQGADERLQRRRRQRARAARVADAGDAARVRGADRAAAATREDTWHRAVEFLFERLAVRWTVEGVETAKQKELLARFRVASPEERAWIRDVLREHLAEWFPDVEAP